MRQFGHIQIRGSKVSLWYDHGHDSVSQAVRVAGEQGSWVVSVQGRSSISSRAGRSFLNRAMAGAPEQEVQLPDELPASLLFPCLLPPRFPAELLPPSASWRHGRPATPWLLGLACLLASRLPPPHTALPHLLLTAAGLCA